MTPPGSILKSHLFRSGEANPILVYPSGSNSYQVDYYSETDQEIIVRTFDMSGRTVRVQKNYLVKGPNTFSLSLDGLARGIYNLQFIADGKRKLTERVLY
ncbi:MAG: T9SS type A sorting domain-containing protein [Bacteroidota bacterium]|nr:MAG: T9SS type A sorting domain-containing protein [Bacteroidota bacterium]